MVLMNAGKMSRNQSSITNRPTCGGNKKAGLGPRVGTFVPSNVHMIGVPNMVMRVCVPNNTRTTTSTGYRATLGMM